MVYASFTPPEVKMVETVVKKGELHLTLTHHEAKALHALLGNAMDRSVLDHDQHDPVFCNLYRALNVSGLKYDYRYRVRDAYGKTLQAYVLQKIEDN